MKILMFGRGVIASIYGWALREAGHEVDFYVRPGRASAYSSGLKLDVLDCRERFLGKSVKVTWVAKFIEELPEDHDYDLIVVSVQHYRFAEAASFLGTRASNATILVFNNFLTDPQRAAAALPAAQLAWGFPAAGGGYGDDDVLTGSLFGQVQFGTFGEPATAREQAVRELFRGCGFKLTEQPDFKGWLWVHFMTNVGLHQELLRGGPARVLTLAGLVSAVRNIQELLPLGDAAGVDVQSHFSSTALFRLPPVIGGGILWLVFRLLEPVRIVVEANVNTNEPAPTCRDALEEARRFGISVPRLESNEALFR